MPANPSGKDGVTTDSAAGSAATMENDLATEAPRASVTRTLKLAVPAKRGVPEITPASDKTRPDGNEPEAKVQVCGSVPPVATNAAE